MGKIVTKPSPGPWKVLDIHQLPGTKGTRYCVVSGMTGVAEGDYKVVAMMAADVSGCRGVREDWSMFPDHHVVWANRLLVIAAPDLLLAAKNNGGGDLFIEDYGRTCHCPYFTKKGGVTREGMMNPKNHATSCNNMWEAICKAEGRPL